MKQLRLILLIIASLCLVACGKSDDEQTVARPVKSFTVQSAPSELGRSFPGKVSANKRVDLAFQVAGQIIKLPVKEGQAVKQGETLAELDARDYQHAYDEDKAKLDYAKVTFERYQELLNKKVVPRSEYDKSRANYQVAIAQTNTAKKALDDTKLLAPFSGVVAKRYVENFENINAKQPILSLQEIDTVEIKVDVPESFIFVSNSKARIKDGDAVAYVTFESLPNKKFPAALKEISTEADETTQTYEVTLIMIPPQGVNVLPGMSVTAYPIADMKTTQFNVPSSAVMVDESGQHYVWVINEEEMTVKKQPVEVGAMKTNTILIKKGLSSDAEIVAAGGLELREGTKVRLMTKTES